MNRAFHHVSEDEVIEIFSVVSPQARFHTYVSPSGEDQKRDMDADMRDAELEPVDAELEVALGLLHASPLVKDGRWLQ